MNLEVDELIKNLLLWNFSNRLNSYYNFLNKNTLKK